MACEKEKALDPDDGSGNGNPSTSFICDSVTVTYTDDVRIIMSQNCAFPGCHGGGSRSGGVNLEDFAAVSAESKRPRFIGAIKHEPGFDRMPRNGGKLPDEQIEIIECWIKQNSPE